MIEKRDTAKYYCFKIYSNSYPADNFEGRKFRNLSLQKYTSFFRQIALNGKTLELIDDRTVPQLVLLQQSASRGIGIKLAALTFGFFVFPYANAYKCI